ncbi:MAG: alpha-amylase family glycosyl hydrolase [Eubacterium sp.]|nr:alpha-amylase family glycosyl hydrolase [Eubacterium sp.]
MHREFEVTRTQAYPLGVCFRQDGMHIAAVCRQTERNRLEEFGVILYDRKHGGGMRIPFPEECKVGSVYAMLLKGYHNKECRYLFYCGEHTWQDPYCKRIENLYRYGTVKKSLPRCMVLDDSYDWGGDQTLGIPYEDMILYALHVRGFTKHTSSGVRYKGTYAGLTEKIPYFKELGITSILLMPAYEFDEIMMQETAPLSRTMEQAAASYKQIPMQEGGEDGTHVPKDKKYKVNYWGYQKGLYYVPKGGYSHSADAVTEYKDMVKELHRNHIETLMQFYFPPEITTLEILDILRYWVSEYHIDGFHLLGVDLPIFAIAKEPMLSETKLLTSQQYDPAPTDYMAQTRRIGWMSDGFLYDMRGALKSDDNTADRMLFHMRNNRPETGIINCIAKWDGMRLMDLVSYDRKHNEQNGEDNQDGTDYNCSWNCGTEGKSRRKNIVELRLRQMKNALSLVLLSQGTPLIYSGDEFGNTQGGNNNPYCQDNAVAWIKWNQMESGRELLEYTKKLIEFRKEHPVLHSKMPLKGMDYLSFGYPDISYHGREAWRPDTDPASRSVGIMYCGRYGRNDETADDSLFYIGINFHWKEQCFGLPQLPKGRKWVLYTSTESAGLREEDSNEESAGLLQEIRVAPRTIAVYVTRDCPAPPAKDKKKEV